MELSGDLWFLGFLKIFSIFLGGLKIVQILNSIYSKAQNSPIRSVVLFIYRKIEKNLLLFNSFCGYCVSELFFVPLLCLLIVLFTSYCIRSPIKFVSNRFCLQMFLIRDIRSNAVFTSECIADCFVLDGSASQYVSVNVCGFLYT